MGSSFGSLCLVVGLDERERGVQSRLAFPGKNHSEGIARYFRPCVRDVDGDGTLDDIGAGLAQSGGNWCAAFASWCMVHGGREGDIKPHEYRAGAIEIENDAKDRGLWVSAQSWVAGAEVRPGDLAIWRRGGPQDPAWWRHVNRVIECSVKRERDGHTLSIKTLDGNSHRRIAIVQHGSGRVYRDLLGFVRYWDPSKRSMLGLKRSAPPAPLFSDEERARYKTEISMFQAAMARQWRE